MVSIAVVKFSADPSAVVVFAAEGQVTPLTFFAAQDTILDDVIRIWP